jgi:uncharacterized membrane protein YhaH (DUF805 family)
MTATIIYLIFSLTIFTLLGITAARVYIQRLKDRKARLIEWLTAMISVIDHNPANLTPEEQAKWVKQSLQYKLNIERQRPWL